MIKNYVVVAIRNLSRYRIHAVINLGGLTIGTAAALVIALYVRDELRFDAFHPQADRLYWVVETRTTPETGERRVAQSAAPVGPALAAVYPEVTGTVRMLRVGRFTVSHGATRFYEGDYLFTEPSFFRLFGYPLISGDPETALTEPHTAVLTEAAAVKYFGTTDAVGRTLTVERIGAMRVTGVLKDLPANSHLQFAVLFSLATLPYDNPRWKQYMDRWDSDGFLTYVALRQPVSDADRLARFGSFLQGHLASDDRETRSLRLQPVSEIHFHSQDIECYLDTHAGSLNQVVTFVAVGVLILLLAGFNYVNLSTALALSRAKELGMRKVLGAGRRQLIFQVTSEAVLLSLLGFLAAVGLVEWLLPAANALTEKQMHLGEDPAFLAVLTAAAFLVGILAGVYPGVYLSGINTVRAVKGLSVFQNRRSFLRSVLVVAQFVVCIVLITATLVVYEQMEYVRGKDLGFDRNHLLVVDINSGNARTHFTSMKDEFLQVPGVDAVSATSRVPGEWKEISTIDVRSAEGPSTATRSMYFIGADEAFLKTYGMALVDGTPFRGVPEDSMHVLLNETAARLMGARVGQSVLIAASYYGGSKTAESFRAQVIGVVRDFNFQSLHEPMAPMIVGWRNNPIIAIDYFTLRLGAQDVPSTLASIQEINGRYDPDHPFEYHFLDAQWDRFYRAESRQEMLIGLAAGLAVLIACLGLYGLAALAAERRTKEIGIRKIVGATVPDVLLLVGKSFAGLVVAAALLAVPIAYLVTGLWLHRFAYPVTVGWLTWILPGTAALVLALATVSAQAFKAAANNPVTTLRCE